jgi:hypothetical protein
MVAICSGVRPQLASSTEMAAMSRNDLDFKSMSPSTST